MLKLMAAACMTVVVVFSIPCAAQTPAPPSAAPAPYSIEKINELSAQFAQVAVGWFVETRCKTLAPAVKAEFMWNSAQTNLGLAHASSENIAMLIQKNAEPTAGKIACGKEAQDTVAAALVLSRQTALAATGKSYSPEASREYDGQNIVALFAIWKVESKCRLMPPDISQEYDGLLAEIEKKYVASYGQEGFDKLKASGISAIPQDGVQCSDRIKALMINALGEARRIAAG